MAYSSPRFCGGTRPPDGRGASKPSLQQQGLNKGSESGLECRPWKTWASMVSLGLGVSRGFAGHQFRERLEFQWPYRALVADL